MYAFLYKTYGIRQIQIVWRFLAQFTKALIKNRHSNNDELGINRTNICIQISKFLDPGFKKSNQFSRKLIHFTRLSEKSYQQTKNGLSVQVQVVFILFYLFVFDWRAVKSIKPKKHAKPYPYPSHSCSFIFSPFSFVLMFVYSSYQTTKYKNTHRHKNRYTKKANEKNWLR